MSTSHLHPPGDKLKKAIKEFSEQLENNQQLDRKKLLEKIIIQFDLSPMEADFLVRQCSDT